MCLIPTQLPRPVPSRLADSRRSDSQRLTMIEQLRHAEQNREGDKQNNYYRSILIFLCSFYVDMDLCGVMQTRFVCLID